MLAAIRAFAKTPWAIALFVLLIFSFAVWGIRDVFHTNISNSVIQAGSREVDGPDFKRRFDREKEQQEQRAGEPISPKDAVAAGLDREVLQQLTMQEVVAEFIRRLGVHPANSLIGDMIAKQPELFNSVNGKLDQAKYGEFLRQNNLTPAKYEGDLRDNISIVHLMSGLQGGLKPPYAYGAMLASWQLESRTISYFVIDEHAVPAPAKPTDDQLNAYLKTHASKLPEMRTFTLVRFSAKALEPTVTVDPAEVQKLFNFRKDSASQPEKRSVVTVPMKDLASAQALAARIRAGEAPEAAAKSVGVQPVSLTDTAKGAMPDPKVADAAFAMKAGDVSAVQGSLGAAVVKLVSITPAQTADFEKMRPALEQQVRADAAGRKAYDEMTKFQDTLGGGASAADAAKAAGVTAVVIGPISQQGIHFQPIPEGLVSEKMVKEVFRLSLGGDGQGKDEGAEYYAVHLDKIDAPALPRLDQVRDIVTKKYAEQAIENAIVAKADDVKARLAKGATLETVAQAVGAKLQHQGGVNRMIALRNPQLGEGFAGAVFGAKVNDVVYAPVKNALIVARIDAILPAPPGEAARMTAGGTGGLTNQLMDDAVQLMADAARDQIKPKSDLNKARAAIGLSPDDYPKDPAAAAPNNPGLAR